MAAAADANVEELVSMIKNLPEMVAGERKDVKILLAGLDGAGKTSFIVMVKTETFRKVKPGRIVKPVAIKRKKIFTVMDLPGKVEFRSQWAPHYEGAQGVIFVVDCDAKDRIEEARKLLQEMMARPELTNCVWLIVGNKQDVKFSLKKDDLTTLLGLEKFSDKKWSVVETASGRTGSWACEDAFQWMVETLASTEKEK